MNGEDGDALFDPIDRELWALQERHSTDLVFEAYIRAHPDEYFID